MKQVKKVAFCTLGCKVNQYETDAIRACFEAEGWEAVPFGKPADAYIINTCAVTGTAAQKSRQAVSRARRLRPDAVIAVAGCLSQSEPDSIKGADIVIGSADKTGLVKLVTDTIRGARGSASRVADIASVRKFEPMLVSKPGERTRASMKIEDGCNSFCSYCIIPYVRGRVRSKQLCDVTAEARAIAASGCHEIVLNGIHLASYGIDLEGGVSLIDAARAAAAPDGIYRLRLGSLEPTIITEDFLSELKLIPGFCPHFHLSLQSGSGDTLRRMNRRYTPEQFARSVELIRRAFPDASVTTDMITGFPGETDAEFEQSYSFAERMNFAKIHVFPYSERKGTAAAELSGSVPKHIRNERAAELIALSDSCALKFHSSFIGRCMTVLTEQAKDGGTAGYTENYIAVTVNKELPENTLVSVLISGASSEGCTAIADTA